jgi:hypothetical protein
LRLSILLLGTVLYVLKIHFLFSNCSKRWNDGNTFEFDWMTDELSIGWELIDLKSQQLVKGQKLKLRKTGWYDNWEKNETTTRRGLSWSALASRIMPTSQMVSEF